MSKKILVHYSRLNHGGAEMSNVRMMNYLASEGWQVDAVFNYAGGSLEHALDERVNKIYLEKKPYSAMFLSGSGVKKVLNIVKYALPCLVSKTKGYFRKKAVSKNHYDIAVVGIHGLDAELVADFVDADLKLHWIRNDLSCCTNRESTIAMINRYCDKINYYCCVSGTSYESFKREVPAAADKAVVFYNFINAEQMHQRLENQPDPYADYGDAKKVVTVCRMSDAAKGLYRMLSVYSRLRADGVFFYWFVVGDGPDKAGLESAVKEKGLDDGFILVGKKDNPFPYYKYADLSATLSYYEGLCGTVNEAKIMGRPVIATEFSGIHEQLETGKNGHIVDNDEDAIYHGMKRLLTDEQYLEQLTNDSLPNAIKSDAYKTALLEDLYNKIFSN